jgi:hypothetical protein
MISDDTVLVQDQEPIVTTVDQEVVMLSIRASAYFGLNGVGSAIWDMLAEQRSFGDVCAALSSRYDADEATLKRDVRWFLDDLLERGLVRIVSADGRSG